MYRSKNSLYYHIRFKNMVDIKADKGSRSWGVSIVQILDRTFWRSNNQCLRFPFFFPQGWHVSKQRWAEQPKNTECITQQPGKFPTNQVFTSIDAWLNFNPILAAYHMILVWLHVFKRAQWREKKKHSKVLQFAWIRNTCKLLRKMEASKTVKKKRYRSVFHLPSKQASPS